MSLQLFPRQTFQFEPDTLNKLLVLEPNTLVLKVPQGSKFDIEGYREIYHPELKEYIFIGNLQKGEFKVSLTSEDGYGIQGVLIVNRDLISNKMKILGISLLLSFIVVIYFGFRFRFAYERKKLKSLLYDKTESFIKEQERLEKALAQKSSIEVSEEGKQKNKGVRFKMVTVLFSNIVGFSRLTEQDRAEKLIDDLDKFYFHFDNTVKNLNIKKIKTIGDTYVCAGGIPKKNRTNPIEVVLAAFEMQQFMVHLKSKYPAEDEKIWGLRIGIHTGPVFAQFDNVKSQKYDIWGETVNIANRVEATGEMGRVNISGSTYELVRDYFLCQYYGKLPVKYRGDADLYVIEGFRPLLSVGSKGLIPNNTFQIKLAFIRFDDLEEEVLDRLERELPENMYYHNLKHTIDVVNQVEIIARREEVSEEEMLLLKTAALFHDVGFTQGYKDHELLGIKIAREILPRFNYSEEQIVKICDLIFATRMPPNPQNKLEEIMCDADLDYLGRADFVPVSNMLFKELVEHEAIENNIERWNNMQVQFISGHQYFTQSAKLLRDVNKQKQLENIRNLAN
jgi:class 3 adenylate cyclase